MLGVDESMPQAKRRRTGPQRRTGNVRGRRQAPETVPAVVIEGIEPAVDLGRFPAKAVAGEPCVVSADIFKDGHDVLKASLLFREKGAARWRAVPMRFLENDRWQASFVPEVNARYEYTLEAWQDVMATWLDQVQKKCPYYPAVPSEVQEGCKHLLEMARDATPADGARLKALALDLQRTAGRPQEVLEFCRRAEVAELTEAYPLKALRTLREPALELIVDRERAQCGAWYEMFPRSQGTRPGVSGTFQDCIRRLPDIRRMGFDVVYLPPIHPIGSTHRKGPNNSPEAAPDSPGSPWAIGNRQGGHKDVHPDLGTLEDFRELVAAARKLDMEIALDFAIQCSPDHPWVKAHPEWFYHLPDGSIRYAENPPKKYEDIYPVNFHNPDWRALWEEMKSIVLYWHAQGVNIFRVDNPHTKPLYFWHWLIAEVQAKHPEVLFLAEAFTRPKIMKFLAKAGFTQSYTYFTWRNAKWELRQYFEELTRTDMRFYFRGNLFTNTPDILTEVLQKGGRPAFKMRAVLAATLLPSWGLYSGFELCENRAKAEGSEEYLDSEKYQLKIWDWERPGNIREFIARLNRIRAENPALRRYANLRFFDSGNENVLCYGKSAGDNHLWMCVNLDPFRVQEDRFRLPLEAYGLADGQSFHVQDLLTGATYAWQGRDPYLRLDPQNEPAHIFRLIP